MNLIKTCLHKNAERYPEKNVIQTTMGDGLSYAALLEQTHCFTNALLKMNHGVVSRVAIVIADNFLLAQSIIVVMSDYIVTPLSPQLIAEEYKRYFCDLKIDLLVTCGDVACQGAIAAANFLKIPILLPDQFINRFTGGVAPYVFKKNQLNGLLLCTSGTTSNPKKVFLSGDKIEVSARNISSTLELLPNDVCLNLMPLFHIHGLIAGLFASIYSGASVLLFNRFNVADFLTDFDRHEPTWVTGTPSIYSSIINRAKYCNYFSSNKKLRFIRSSSAPLRERLHNDLEHIFSAPVIQAYGMTEACHQIVSQTVKKRSLCTSVGFPTTTKIQILGDDKQFLPANTAGEIVIKGPTIISAYENDEVANTLSFYKDWFCTGDLGYLTEKGELFITGRIKEIINKSGEKISPYEVEDVIGKLPSVSEVVCFPIPDEHIGEKVGVALVLNQGFKTNADAIQNHVSLYMAQYKVPDFVFFVESLPKNASGKLQRNSLADLLAIQVKPLSNSNDSSQSSNNILSQLLEIVENVFKLSNIQPNVTFFELGGDSLLGLQLIVRINDYFDTDLNVGELYEHPVLSMVAELIVGRKRSSGGARLPVLASLSIRPKNLELSSAQARIWFISHLPGAQSLYHMAFSYRLKGSLSLDSLQKSIALFAQRHEQLRLIIKSEDGKPYQYISEESIALNIINFDPLPHQSMDQQLQETINKVVKNGFNVNGGALFKPYLLQIAHDDNVLLLHLHHMISDGWSKQLLQKELSLYYNAYSQNKEIDEAPPAISYIDYVYWLREWQTEAWLKQEASFWRDCLDEASPLLALPTDYPRPKEMSYEGAVEHFELSEELVRALKQFADHHQMSLYMVMLTVFKVLLTHYTGEQKIVVGTVMANRSVPQAEEIIGFFANTLVMVTDLPGTACWEDAFESVKKSTLNAFQHTDLPFEALVKEINPERQLNYHPIFQVFFNLVNVPQHDLNLSGLSSTELERTHVTWEPFDLNVSLIPSGKVINGQFRYNKKLFKAETIQRWTEHYIKLLGLAISNLTSAIGTTDFLLADEKDLLLNQWIATKVDHPSSETAIGKFEKVVAKNPNDIALVCGDREMTYAELDNKASVVGKILVQNGVKPGDLVAICIDRSLAMVIGLLGIWKAGAGYVPLDRRDPVSRLEHIVNETQCGIILSDAQSIEVVGVMPFFGKIIQIDNDVSSIGTETIQLPLVKAENIAYVFYTSGSTGVPKGVIVEHRSLWGFLWAGLHDINIQARSRILQLAPYTSDTTISDLYLPLMSNVTVVLPEADKYYDLKYLTNLISQKRINIIKSVPSLLRRLGDVLKINHCPDLHTIYSGGETILFTDVQLLCSNTGANVYNHYGPTEGVGLVTQGYCSPTEQNVTLGYPIQNTRLYVLNTQLQPVPIGCYGELYIGNAHLAQGYLKNDILTADRFIPNPFANLEDYQSGRYLRLYKSGDKVRWLTDGRLEFAGRMDFQVKIRGHRVEPGEIEAVISTHCAIQSIVVIKYLEQLVALVVLNQEIEIKTLRHYALEKLPSYMQPAHWIILTEIPYTKTGKVDRKSLLTLVNQDLFANDHAEFFVEPHTSEAIWLATQWTQLLKIETIGLNDNFFMLGGDSLLGLQLIVRINDYFNTDLNVGELYERPVLSMVAELIVGRKRSSEGARLPVLASLSIRPKNLELSSAQARIWFINHLPGAQNLYHMAFSYRLKGSLSLDSLQKSIALLAQRHEQLRLIIKSDDGRPYQYISEESIALNVINLDPLPHQSMERQLQETINTVVKNGFNVNGGSLFKPYLLQIAHDDNVLLLHLHHMISDGWSKQLLQKELSLYYNAYSQNKEIDEAPPAISYIDYVYWLREWQTEAWLKQEASFWRDCLDEASPLLALPTDYPRPKEMSYEGGVEHFELSEELVRALKQFAAHHQMSMYMVMLTVFKVLLTHYTGEQKIVVGTVMANRSVPQAEEIIGFFANTLVMVTDLPGTACWEDAFDSVKKSTLNAFQHTDLPFEALIKEINPERQLNYHPIFQVIFNLINVPQHDLNLIGLSSTELAISNAIEEPFDLNVSLVPFGNGFKGRFIYNKQLFKSETIQRWTEHYKKLLGLAITNLTCSIGTADFLLADEKDLLLKQWTATEVDYPRDETAIGQFEKVAAANPNDIALIYCDREMTYAELDAKASVVGKILVHNGVEPGDLVAICIDRSFTMVIGLLGIWKAGAGYVPLDRRDPVNRLDHILQETQCKIIVSDDQSIETVAAVSFSGKKIKIDDNPSLLGADDADLPLVKPENSAYVLYTSGSTGKPKGVVVEHSGLWDYLCVGSRETSLKSHNRFLQLASYTFEETLFDLYLPLISNVAVVLPEPNQHHDTRYLVNLIHERKVNYINSVPSFLRLLGMALKENQSKHICGIYAAGEELTFNDVSFLYENTGATICNRYGQTETVGVVTQGYCVPGDKQVTLGRPVGNTRLYVLNAQHHPIPLGCYGELYIAKDHLAKGYLGNDALTADSFIPNPFLSVEDRQSGRYLRMYKSGDKVRWLADGRLQFAGRMDFQVKIRGHRVEPGEIEAVIATHPAIQAIVIIKHSEQLVAFVVPKQSVEIKALRLYAIEKLPSFMQPAHWIILTELPFTKTGKIDRKALAALVSEDLFVNDNAQFCIEPHTPEAIWLATQWVQLLKIETIGLNDNFFMLGGDSLLGLQLIARINDYFNTNLNVGELYEHPVLSEVANLIVKFKSLGECARLPVLVPLSIRPNLIELSSMQARIWFISHLPGAQSLYQMVFSYRLKGTLSLDALQKSIELLVQRHEQLRLQIKTNAGRPYQHISKENIVLHSIQLDQLTHQSRDQQLHEIIDAIVKVGFNENSRSLFQPYLLQVSSDDNVLLFHMHHMVGDGWSRQLLQRELGLYYNAYSQNKEIDVPPPSINYIDYVYWLREWQTDAWLKKEVSFWRDCLDGASPLLALPTDYPRPKEMSYDGAVEHFELSDELVHALNQFAAHHQMSLYMVMLTVFKVLLTHYTGEQKIVVGTVMANRSVPKMEEIIGFFANTLVMVTDLPGTVCWEGAFKSVKKSTLHALQHTTFPFEGLVRELNPERQLNYHPIFQVFFNLVNVPQHDLNLSGLSSTELERTHVTWEPFDLNVSLIPSGKVINGQFRYNKKLFKAETIQRWTEHYIKLLGLAISNLTSAIGTTDFLLADEKDLLLNQWIATEVDHPSSETAIGKFEKVVAKNPNDIALVCGDREMTYAELDNKASVVGKILVQNGVKPGDLVAICIDRSLAMVIGLLGIWKAGAGYVPLDRRDPVSRLEHIVNETQCGIILSDAQSIEVVAVMPFFGKIIQIDNDVSSIETETIQLPLVKAENIAYVFYTSGSTGVPKGVIVEHRSLWGFLWAGLHDINIQARSRILQLAPYTSDTTISDLYLPLMSNVTVVLPEADKYYDLKYLANLISQKRINIIKSVPSLLRRLGDVLKINHCPDLHTIYSGGETILFTDVQLLCSNTGANVYNHYGPTEGVGLVTQGYCSPTEQNVTLGYPIQNTRLYVLNTQLQPVPIGCYGELYIGNAHLAKGYLKNDTLTADRFIPNPFANLEDYQSGRYLRLYKSGDKVRWLTDGRLEFAGRMDFQVKIRGHRVEPGEIEAVISNHCAIQSIVVIKHLEQLVALVVLNQEIETRALRLYALEKLPSFMLPTHWIILTEMPFTKTNKVDRKSLPALVDRDLDIKKSLAPIREAVPDFLDAHKTIERVLINIWEKLFNQSVSSTDNFFDLGGHSLLAMQLFFEITQELRENFPLSAIYQLTTIQEMVQHIITKQMTDAVETPLYQSDYGQLLSVIAGVNIAPIRLGSLIIGMNIEGGKRPLFWCGNGYHEQIPFAKFLGKNQPLYILFSGQKAVKFNKSNDNFKKLAAHYVNEILSIQPEGPYLIGGNCFAGHVTLEIAVELFNRGKKVDALLLLEYFNNKLFEYPGNTLLVFAKESHFQLDKKFNWGSPNWEKSFKIAPTVGWVPGPHGIFMSVSRVKNFSKKISDYLF